MPCSAPSRRTPDPPATPGMFREAAVRHFMPPGSKTDTYMILPSFPEVDKLEYSFFGKQVHMHHGYAAILSMS